MKTLSYLSDVITLSGMREVDKFTVAYQETGVNYTKPHLILRIMEHPLISLPNVSFDFSFPLS